MRRPPSVWLAQGLLSIVCVISLPAVLTWTVVAFMHLWRSTKTPADVMLFFVEFVVKTALVSFLAVTVVALGKRWPRSRLMGLAALTLVVLLLAYSRLNPTPPGQGLPKYELTTPAERGWAFIGNVLMFVGLGILTYRVGFSRKARTFLSPPPATAESAPGR